MNPFAKNAGAERNRRRDEKAARDRRTNIPQTRTPTGQSSNSKENDLAKKIAEAKKNLSPSATQSPVSRNQPVENIQSDLETKTESKANRESRLDELRRKSQANQANAKSIVKKEEPVVKPEVKAKIEPEGTAVVEYAVVEPVVSEEKPMGKTEAEAKVEPEVTAADEGTLEETSVPKFSSEQASDDNFLQSNSLALYREQPPGPNIVPVEIKSQIHICSNVEMMRSSRMARKRRTNQPQLCPMSPLKKPMLERRSPQTLSKMKLE